MGLLPLKSYTWMGFISSWWIAYIVGLLSHSLAQPAVFPAQGGSWQFRSGLIGKIRMECALSWGAGNGGLDRRENSFTFLIILCLFNYPQVCFSFPCPLWECEAGLLGALGSMKGEFPRNLADFRVGHTHFRTQLLSLLLFVCFSSSSLAFLWPVFPSSPPPPLLLSHLLTQLSAGPSC